LGVVLKIRSDQTDISSQIFINNVILNLSKKLK